MKNHAAKGKSAPTHLTAGGPRNETTRRNHAPDPAQVTWGKAATAPTTTATQ